MPLNRYSSPSQHNVATGQLKRIYSNTVETISYQPQKKPNFLYSDYLEWLHFDIVKTSPTPFQMNYNRGGRIVLPLVKDGVYECVLDFNEATKELQNLVLCFIRPTLLEIDAKQVIKSTIFQG